MSAPVTRPKECATPGCGAPLPEQSGRGRPRLYCSPRCRVSGRNRTGPVHVEVDHALDDDGRRPTGRVWLVRLRRGGRAVVVASELGRPSADHLARQITDLIGPRRRAERGAME